MIKSGYAEFTMDGVLYKLEPGKSFLFPANRYITYSCPEKFSLYWFHFHVKMFDSIDLLDHFECPYELPTENETFTEDLYKKLFEMDVSDNAQKDFVMPAIIQMLAAPFLSRGNFNKNGNVLLKLEPALKYIEKNISIPIRIAELAEQCDLEESYFADLFSKTIGIPPAKYVTKRKVEIAKSLLTIGTKIEETSRKLGFYDSAHFSRTFKKLTGMNPSVYINKNKSKVAVPG
jgi:AraC-like DNA-binding protein